MAKYVVNSGGIIYTGDFGRRYMAETLKGLGDHPNLLFCFFANPIEQWDEKFSSYATKSYQIPS